MSLALFWIGLAVSGIGAVAGRLLINMAVAHVREKHPATYDELASQGRALVRALSQPDGRVRRVMASRMLLGGLPDVLEADPDIQRMRGLWRVLSFATLVGFVVVILVIAARGGAWD